MSGTYPGRRSLEVAKAGLDALERDLERSTGLSWSRPAEPGQGRVASTGRVTFTWHSIGGGGRLPGGDGGGGLSG